MAENSFLNGDAKRLADASGLLLDEVIRASRENVRRNNNIPTTEIVVAGPMLSGKSTLAYALAGALRFRSFEGDLLHSELAMEAARNLHQPMTDEYREVQWYSQILAVFLFAAYQNMEIVLTCSALKKRFREALVKLGNQIGVGDLHIVWLDVSPEEMRRRAQKRKERVPEHPFGPEMVDSQLRDTERPTEDESNVTIVNGEQPIQDIIKEISQRVPGLPAIGI